MIDLRVPHRFINFGGGGIMSWSTMGRLQAYRSMKSSNISSVTGSRMLFTTPKIVPLLEPKYLFELSFFFLI